jgi:hypothetical protein
MRRTMACLAVAVLCVAASCVDSKFVADDVDAGRLEQLRADPTVAFLKSAGASCQDQLAHYRPASGEPLDFAGVELNQVTCHAPRELAGRLLDVATAGGWGPAWSLLSFELRRKFGDAWGRMSVENAGAQLSVRLLLPPHTEKGSAPGPWEIKQGRACLASARTGQPPAEGCALQL